MLKCESCGKIFKAVWQVRFIQILLDFREVFNLQITVQGTKDLILSCMADIDA